MKNIFKISALLSLLFVATSCDKDEDRAVLNSDAGITGALSTTNITLDKAKADENALSVSWENQNVNLDLSHSYTIVMTSSNGKTKNVSATSSPVTFTHAELNKILISELEQKAGTPSEISIVIKDEVSNRYHFLSAAQTLQVTPYVDLIAPTEWGVVGSATPNGWDGPDVNFWKIPGDADNIVAYVTLQDGFIKFRKNNDWAENLGGSAGTLSGGGADIAVTAGTYKILLNVEAKTYSIEKYTWGIVGDAANGWGEREGNDIPFTYDGTTNSWVAKGVVLKNGDIKFRLNNKWGGDKGGASNVLTGSLGGNNITVTAGTYNITVNFTDETYSIVAQ